ncbi:type IV secretory system conjugative DNA transfer family protein [Bacillus subtilis]|uniref:type IV secretory system conjugative DNA transfer family protein n=1 Tax=Bacillus subtilis TaxID=1423 RepID=UPI0034E1EB16
MRLNAVIKSSEYTTDRILGVLSQLAAKSLDERPSLVFNDPDDELFKKVAVQLKNFGYEVYQFKDTDTASSMQYNPLEYLVELQKNGLANKLNETVDDISYYLFEDEDGPFKVLARSVFKNELVTLIEKSAAGGETVSFKSLDINTSEILDQQDLTKEVKETILFNIKAKLNGEAFKKLSESSIDLQDIGFSDKPVAIFLSDSENALVNLTKSIFIEHLYSSLCRQVFITLRDFEKMIPIRNIGFMVALSIGRSIYFNLLVDSETKLLKRYGETTTSWILSNCKGPMGAEYAAF